MSEEEERLQPVTFGSVIYFSTESNLDSFMFSDGFIDTRVTLKPFSQICEANSHSHHDFSFCLFMVLPFLNESAFEVQKQVIAGWRDQLLNPEVNSKLEDRKSTVIGLKNRLESELQFNMTTLQKSQNSNICFGSSNFMLLHINSLKFLHLFQDDNNNLFLDLTANPNKYSFFNFDASLKLQRGRSDNFVYEDEIVYITCTEKFSGKSSYMCLQNNNQTHQPFIIGAIDEKENWKVNIYEEPIHEEEASFMRVGSSLWILLSEKHLFLNGARSKDPFKELYDYKYTNLGQELLQQQKKKEKPQLNTFLEKLFKEKREMPDLSAEFLAKPSAHFFDQTRMHVQLSKIPELSDKVGEIEELSSFGLWKIEGLNVKRGGLLKWSERYRLKHIVTGMYLSVQPNPYILKLTQMKDQTTEFEFVPIENLLAYENQPKTRGLIQKDAFFMIKNSYSQTWIGFEEGEDIAQNAGISKPVLFDVKIDMNTFRFREASYESVWENYFLVSSVPLLLKFVQNKIHIDELLSETSTKRDVLERKTVFDQLYPRILVVLNQFIDFLLNRIFTNINQEQEIMYPSDVRQVKFQQLFLLGLICWFLIEMFPNFSEFEKLQLNPLEKYIQKNIIKKRKNFKPIKANSYNIKICTEQLIKKYKVVQTAYKVLQTACYQNPENQELVFGFLPKLSDHIGLGGFVSECMQTLMKNQKLLHQLHRLRFDENVNLFQKITHQLKLFEPYNKREILDLLGSLTYINKQSIFINQDKVFSSIVDNKNFLFGHLFKILQGYGTNGLGCLQIEYRVFVDKEYESRQAELVELIQDLEIRDRDMLDYFRSQLNLYALLCQNRNYACVKNMRELMQQKVLIQYLESQELSDDFRAIICFMVSNLYIDREPRTIIHKPNYVRVFRPPEQKQQKHNIVQVFSKKKKIKNKNKVAIEIEADPTSMATPQDDDLTARFIEINLAEDIVGAHEIREWLIKFLESRTEIALKVQNSQEQNDISSKVYNQLTYQVVRSLNMMIQFGLFTKYASQLMYKAIEEKWKMNNETPQFDIESQNHLEKLVNMLGFLLEFEFIYQKELTKHDFKKTYLERQIKRKQESSSMSFLQEYEAKQSVQQDEEEEHKNLKNQDGEDETQKYQFLKKYQSLLRIIQHFTNKTYTGKDFEISVSEDYQVSIKLEICEIFSLLLQWREDFYMENTLIYFQQHFYQKYLNEQDIYKQQADTINLQKLMPDLFAVPGEDVLFKQSQFTKLSQKEEVRDLDIILDRPFVEILLQAFYFSQDPQLQNSLADLIFMVYNQREKLIRNIQKISLVEESGVQSYSKLSSLVNKLKGLLSSSQNWLQIIEQNNYDEKAEETLLFTKKKLNKTLKVFQANANDSAFLIKQKVFKHLGGHKMILKFIEQGATVIDARVDYFKEDSLSSQFSYKNQFIQNVRTTFILSHRILSVFMENNPSNQNSVFKVYGKILPMAVNINVGQIEFIQELFKSNQQLCFNDSPAYYQYTVNQIKSHGHFPSFLGLFQVFLDVAHQRPDSILIQKSILNWLFNDEYIKYVNPLKQLQRIYDLPQFFQADHKQSHLYLIQFMQVLCQCLHSDVSINQIVKVNMHISVKDLLQVLLDESCNEMQNRKLGPEHDPSKLKVNICEILQIFFVKLDTATEQLKSGAIVFIDFLDHLVGRLKSSKNLSHSDQIFMGVNVLNLVNTYFEHFLKDTGMIALKMLANDPHVEKEKKVFEFANQFINSLNNFQILLQDSFREKFTIQISKLVKNFNLVLSEEFNDINQYISIQQNNYEGEDFVQQVLNVKKQQVNNIPAVHVNINNNRKLRSVVDTVMFTKMLGTSQNIKGNQEYLDCWEAFVEVLIKSVHLKKAVKEEKMRFPDVIYSVSKMFNTEVTDIRLRELLIGKDDIVIKLLQYIQHWKTRGANRGTIIFILKSIRSLILSGDKNEKAKQQRQNYLDNLNCTQIVLKLYWKDKQTEDQYILQLVKLIIGLLDGGNKNIQMSILQLFKKNADSEAFFRKIFNVLTKEMNTIKKNIVQTHEQHKFIEKTLRVIQLLCEGHNTLLQDYLRQQTNSKISYDLVNLMVKLVITHKISNDTYLSVVQCLETLTEVVQGPCKDNQMVIVTSKFLEWSVDLLREEEKLFDVHPEEDRTPLDMSLHPHAGQKRKPMIHRGLLMRLKYKCTVTLLSLLEMQENNIDIINRIVRSIPCSVIANELTKLYQKYKKKFKDDYPTEAFKCYENEIDIQKPDNPDDEVIIEYGFNLFILTNILMIKNPKQDTELEDVQNIIEKYQYVEEEDNDVDLFGDLSKLGSSVLASSIGAFKNLGTEEKISEVQREQHRLKMQKDAYNFFAQKTAFIEVVRDDELQRLYFPILPECQLLPKENRKEFHEKVDHSSSRAKLGSLMQEGTFMIQVMKHEENLSRMFKTSKLLEIVASHKTWWENLAFISNIILNVTILASYSQYVYTDPIPLYYPNLDELAAQNTTQNLYNWIINQDKMYNESIIDPDKLSYARLYEPRLFFQNDFTFTDLMIQIMGIITLVFSSLVVIFFILKKAPLLIKDIWVNFKDEIVQFDFVGKVVLISKKCLMSLKEFCTDFDFVYYSSYISCVILGLLVHPFIFIFLFCDFLRIATLKIVVKAIWISKKQMGLTSLVFLLIEYYFTIIGYIYLWDTYQPNQCDSVWECFLVTIDWTFKDGGSMGGYLVDKELQDNPINYNLSTQQQERYMANFTFVVLFKFLLVFLVINMVAGIIIDTFGALKDEMLEKQRNLTEYCFICGIEREKLDKSSKHGYYSHIKKDHYMWNYIYYKAYLFFKPKTEFSGNETYIMRQLASDEIDWFPVKRAMGVVVDEEEGEEEENSQNIQYIKEVSDEIPKLEELTLKCITQIKTLFEKN